MTDLLDLIEHDLGCTVAQPACRMAELLAGQFPGTCAVLFYGACLREPETGGIFDFYVLTDRPSSLLHRLVPPAVYFVEAEGIAAKVAVITLRSFAARAAGRGVDTTIWARFCQPVALVWVRDTETRTAVVRAVAAAVRTAVRWAVLLGPGHGLPRDHWIGLFRHTYGAELRVEGAGRAALVYGWAAKRYDRLFRAALMDMTFSPAERQWAQRKWRWLRLAGKLWSIVRLAKASFTFSGGVDYALAKLERHAKRRLRLTAWQRRHPLLAGPWILWRLYRDELLR